MRMIETISFDIQPLQDEELNAVSGGVDKIDMGFFGRWHFSGNEVGFVCFGTPEVGVEMGSGAFDPLHAPDLVRRAATYIDKILEGAKPGRTAGGSRLPSTRPAINLKTAKAAGHRRAAVPTRPRPGPSQDRLNPPLRPSSTALSVESPSTRSRPKRLATCSPAPRSRSR